MSNDNSNEKANIIEKILFENLIKVNELSKTKNDPTTASSSSSCTPSRHKSTIFLREKLTLDETQLVKLNSIVSNLPIELIRQSYEKYRVDDTNKATSKKKPTKQSFTKSASSAKFKSNSTLRRKQIEAGQNTNFARSHHTRSDKESKSSKTGGKSQSSAFGSTSSLASSSHTHHTLTNSNQIGKYFLYA